MRAQAHSVEAVVASILLLTGLVFALQVTAVTPLSASTSSQHLENQQEATAEGVLASAGDTGALSRALRLWRPVDGNGDGRAEFRCAGSQPFYTGAPESSGDCGAGAYAGRTPTAEFGSLLYEAFGRRGLAYNVDVHYETGSGTSVRRLVYVGEPSDNAVTATSYVTLYDDQEILDVDDGDGDTRPEPTGTTLTDPSANFYAADQHAGRVFGVFRVEVTVWRQ